jgi:PadR family transcriptional regulator AphA
MSERKTRFVILGLLSEGGLSGYDIKKLVTLRFQYFWQESYGQIYPELKSLTNEGLIRLAETGLKNKRRKSMYEITDKGKREMERWLAVPPDKEMARYELLLKVYFGNLTEESNVINYIRDFRSRYTVNLGLLREFIGELKPLLGDSDNHLFILLTVLFGEKVYQAYLDWCDEAVKLINKRLPPYKERRNAYASNAQKRWRKKTALSGLAVERHKMSGNKRTIKD